jgi:bacillopeptidase F (M6 metalloprotease family)
MSNIELLFRILQKQKLKIMKAKKLIQNLTKKLDKISHIKCKKAKQQILLRYFDRL